MFACSIASFSPAVVHALQKAVSGAGGYATYRVYSELVHKRPPTELRDLLDFVGDRLQVTGDSGSVQPVPCPL